MCVCARARVPNGDHVARSKAVVGNARQLLEECRERLRQQAMVNVQSDADAAVDGENTFFKQAVQRWGPKVGLIGPKVTDWEKYLKSRLAVPLPLPSPYMLLQEVFAADTWKLLIACVLMSRVSSADVKHRCIGGFFAKYPTPSAALDADPAEVQPILAALGHVQIDRVIIYCFLLLSTYSCGILLCGILLEDRERVSVREKKRA